MWPAGGLVNHAIPPGAPVEMQIFQLMTLHDGKIVRIRMYHDQAEALEAAGLRE